MNITKPKPPKANGGLLKCGTNGCPATIPEDDAFKFNHHWYCDRHIEAVINASFPEQTKETTP